MHTHTCKRRASPVGAFGADVVVFRADVVCRPICTHVFSGTDGDASLPLGSVNSIAFFSSVPVGEKCDSTQTVAVRLIGGGLGFPGTLKSTLALQNIGSIVACTVQLSRCRYAMRLFPFQELYASKWNVVWSIIVSSPEPSNSFFCFVFVPSNNNNK